jgi:hypothetical protein
MIAYLELYHPDHFFHVPLFPRDDTLQNHLLFVKKLLIINKIKYKIKNKKIKNKK